MVNDDVKSKLQIECLEFQGADSPEICKGRVKLVTNRVIYKNMHETTGQGFQNNNVTITTHIIIILNINA